MKENTERDYLLLSVIGLVLALAGIIFCFVFTGEINFIRFLPLVFSVSSLVMSVISVAKSDRHNTRGLAIISLALDMIGMALFFFQLMTYTAGN